MLGEIKEELLKNPEAIVEILEYFGFTHMKLSSREIRFARDDIGGRNISIRLERNECLYVNDYSRGVNADFFQYIIQEKNVTFREVLQKTKQVLNLSDDWRPQEKKTLFGGIYKKMYDKARNVELRCYEDSDFYNRYTMAMDGAEEKITAIIRGIFRDTAPILHLPVVIALPVSGSSQ